jgi:hypothetical protein
VDTQPTQPVDTGAAPTDAAPAPSTPHGEETPKDDRPRDEQGRFAAGDSKPSKPDPIKAAIDRLAKPATQAKPDAAKPPAGTPTQAAQKPKEAPKAPEAKPTDEALKSRTNDDLDAPPEEKAAWRPATKERFDKVLAAARTSREELEKAKPDIEIGRGYNQLVEDFDLREDIGFVPPEHFAGVVKAQAAVNRSLLALEQGRQPAPQDLATVKALSESIGRISASIGIAAPTPAAAEVKPFEGELTSDMRDLVEVYGYDEKRVRLLAALEGKTSQAAPQAKVNPPAPQPATTPAPAPQERPSGVDMVQLYGRKLMSDLTALGVQNPGEQVRVLLRHPATKQEVIKRFPGLTVAEVPAVFDALDPQTRYEILKAAHTATTAKPPVPARPSTPPPATPTRTLTGVRPAGGGNRPAVGDANAVSSAVDYLAAD